MRGVDDFEMNLCDRLDLLAKVSGWIPRDVYKRAIFSHCLLILA